MVREDRRLWTALIALLMAFAVGASPVAPAALLLADPAPEIVDRLRDEKVVVDGPQPRSDGGSGFVGYVVFDRPVERVFELLRDTARQAEFRPDLDRVESVERSVDGTLDEHHVRVGLTDPAYRLRYRFEPTARRISRRLD